MKEPASQLILLVEDDTLLAKITKEAFEEHGYRVAQATSGIEALELIEKKHPDIVLSEVLLPKMDGFTLIEKVRKSKRPETPIVLVTSLGQVHDIERGKAVGAVDYIIKSHTSLGDVVRRVEKTLQMM